MTISTKTGCSFVTMASCRISTLRRRPRYRPLLGIQSTLQT